MRSNHRFIGMAVCIGLIGVASTAAADPTQVTVSPPLNARFATGQRFDIRVEGAGTGPYSATIEIDGKPKKLTSGAQNTTSTDDITSNGYGGFNIRGFSENKPGLHTIKATFKDSTGTVTVRSQFEVVDVDGCKTPIKNVIIMLGDGMGTAHRTAARLVRHGVTGGDPNGYLAMDYFPHTGMVTTHSLNSIITDSAPGMACYSTGTHSNNNQEGVFPAHVTNAFFAPRVEYMAEYLHRTEGKSLGLVTTADVEDATPAANAVHTINRNAGTGIVDQYLDEADPFGKGHSGNGLQVLLGGGRRWFLPSDQFGSGRPDATPARQNLVGVYDAAGFPKYNILGDGYPETFDIDGKILFGFGASADRYENWLTKARPLVDTLLPTTVQSDLVGAGYSIQPVDRPDTAGGFFLRGQAAGKTQAVHTASDIPVSAYSPNVGAARQFVGVQRNVDVFVKLMRAALGNY